MDGPPRGLCQKAFCRRLRKSLTIRTRHRHQDSVKTKWFWDASIRWSSRLNDRAAVSGDIVRFASAARLVSGTRRAYRA